MRTGPAFAVIWGHNRRFQREVPGRTLVGKPGITSAAEPSDPPRQLPDAGPALCEPPPRMNFDLNSNGKNLFFILGLHPTGYADNLRQVSRQMSNE